MNRMNQSNKPVLTRADLIDQVDRTRPAVVRLMELHERGRSYIKP